MGQFSSNQYSADGLYLSPLGADTSSAFLGFCLALRNMCTWRIWGAQMGGRRQVRTPDWTRPSLPWGLQLR